MRTWVCLSYLAVFSLSNALAAGPMPAPQQFRQEIATRYTPKDGLPDAPVQLIQALPQNGVRVFAGGRW